MLLPDSEGHLKIPETCRPGRDFVFQIGIDKSRLDGLVKRVTEAYTRFESMPIVAGVANSLEEIVLVSSIHGTNKVEGGLLNEDEVREVIIESGGKFVSAEEQKRRILNLKRAYEYTENLISQQPESPLRRLADSIGLKSPFRITEQNIKELHQLAMAELMPKSELGSYRHRTRESHTVKVGDADHGGTYTPPLCLEDIQKLMTGLLEWLNSEPVKSLSVLYTAPLLHFYFERIHPFSDGNGRVGRILEAMQLRLGLGKFASYGIWQYYWEHIDEYFNLFNRCGKSEKNGDLYPNTAFVEFFLNGMLITINRLHDRANEVVATILEKNYLNDLFRTNKLNRRQYAIMMQLSILPPIKRSDLNQLPWYNALYDKLTRQTKSRDLRKLQDLKLIFITEDIIGLLKLKSSVSLSAHPNTRPYS